MGDEFRTVKQAISAPKERHLRRSDAQTVSGAADEKVEGAARYAPGRALTARQGPRERGWNQYRRMRPTTIPWTCRSSSRTRIGESRSFEGWSRMLPAASR